MGKFRKIAYILASMSMIESSLKEMTLKEISKEVPFKNITDVDLLQLQSALKKFENKIVPGSVS